jgi:hypothetical protein
MSWIPKMSVLVPALLAVSVFGQRIEFDARGGKATLKSSLVSTRADESGVKDVVFHLRVPAINVDKQRDGFDSVAVDGMVPLLEEGKPELASTGSIIAVPQGYKPVLSVRSSNVRMVENVTVMPVQKRFRCETNSADSFVFDSNLYKSNELYPAESVVLEEVGELQGLRLMRVGVHPVQMDMGKNRLLVNTEAEIAVHFERVGATKPLSLPSSMYEFAKASASNGEGLGNLVTRADGNERMIVVTAPELESAIQPLVEWKRKKGIDVDVVSYVAAGGNKDAVKSYIKAYYEKAERKPSYLLFVGNKTTAPGFMESTGSGSAASDWRFALITGPADQRIPDLFYGRILADNEAEVATQVKRIIAYEKSPEQANWYTEAATIASSEGSGPSDKEYGEQVGAGLKAGSYTNVDHFLQGEQTATAANISAALQKGRSWLAYFGHGSGTGWGSTNGGFNNSTVEGLGNSRLPVLIDVACLNASWVNISKPFGKVWMTAGGDSPTGAVAYYGGSVSISWHPPAVMSVGIAKMHFEKNLRSTGASVLGGQVYLFEKSGNTNATLDNIKWYNLFGDPSMVIRSAAPLSE